MNHTQLPTQSQQQEFHKSCQMTIIFLNISNANFNIYISNIEPVDPKLWTENPY